MSDIYIQGESLQVEKKFDYAIIEGINETVESLKPKVMKVNMPIHYSDTEQIIGTWFGKILYQKTVEFGYLSNAASASVQCNISNLDRIVSISGSGQAPSYAIPLPLPHPTYPITCFYNIDTDEITIVTTSDRSTTYAFITFQYTKTTD